MKPDQNKFEIEFPNKKWKKEFGSKFKSSCLHDACPDCNGSGRKKDGTACVHYISCKCPRCTPTYM